MCEKLKRGNLSCVKQTYAPHPVSCDVPSLQSEMTYPAVTMCPLPQSTSNFIVEASNMKMVDGNMIREPNVLSCDTQLQTNIVEGFNYLVQDKRLWGKGKSAGQEYVVTDVILDSIPLRRIFLDRYGEEHVQYVCVLKSQKWGKETRTIEVDAEDLYQLYQKVREKFPEAMLSTKGADAISESISDVVTACKDKMQTEYSYELSGWYEDADGINFYKGTHPEYARWDMPDLKELAISEKCRIFMGGFNFLEVGHHGKEITGIFLYSHLGFSLYWVRRAGFNVNFLLYLKGWTGSLKTSTLVELINTFAPDVTERYIQLTDSSWARIRELLLLCQDGILFIDDFAKTQKNLSRDGAITIEKIARAVGNGKLSEKMKPGGVGSQVTGIRSLVAMTGEDNPELGNSSFLRMLTIEVERGTFDGKALEVFQGNRTLMSCYFALYIEFLRRNGDEVIRIIKRGRELYRAETAVFTEEPRLRETAMSLLIQLDIVVAFGLWCDVEEAAMRTFREIAAEHIEELIRNNTKERTQTRADVLFVKALWKQITCGSKYQLAENGTIYHENRLSCYIGFYDKENDFIWLKVEDSMIAVQDYCKRHGLSITSNDDIIKRKLHENGVLIRPEKGWVSRWTKGKNRGRFIKLSLSAVRKIVEEEE